MRHHLLRGVGLVHTLATRVAHAQLVASEMSRGQERAAPVPLPPARLCARGPRSFCASPPARPPSRGSGCPSGSARDTSSKPRGSQNWDGRARRRRTAVSPRVVPRLYRRRSPGGALREEHGQVHCADTVSARGQGDGAYSRVPVEQLRFGVCGVCTQWTERSEAEVVANQFERVRCGERPRKTPQGEERCA